MKVVVHPADEGGCGAYRIIFPANVLRDQGHDVTVGRPEDAYRAVFQPSPWGDRVIGLDETVDADVVVLQRPMHRHRVELIAALQAQGVAVVVEVDDDFHALHRRNPAWLATNPARDRDHNRDWLLKACELADLVTVSTPALAARYGAHGRVAVLPNFVPAWYLDVERTEPSEGRVLVGWSGNVHTHPGDLEVTDGAVARAACDAGAQIAVVGTGNGVRRALRMAVEPAALGWQPIDRYPIALAALDVGVVPLAPTPFNEAKSNLKMSEMAALGVACVGSPTSENLALGAGLIAHTPDDWYRITHHLVSTPSARLDAACQARQMMQARTYEGQAWRWWEAWQRASMVRQGSAAA